jgi:hypothetical protein
MLRRYHSLDDRSRAISAPVPSSDANKALVHRSVTRTIFVRVNVKERRKIACAAFQILGIDVDH